MRKTLVVSTLLIASLVAASAQAAGPVEPYELEMRSALYSLTIRVTDTGNDVMQYDTRLRDLKTNQIIASPQLSAKRPEFADSRSRVGGLDVHIRIGYTPRFLSATLEVLDGSRTVDFMRTWWSGGQSSTDSSLEPAAMMDSWHPGVAHAGGKVHAPIATHRVDPVYPEAARRERVSGIVILEVLIDKNGVVSDARVLKGLPEGLSEAALEAVKQWTFSPATMDGAPVDVLFNLTTNFRLDVPPAKSQ